MIAANQPVRIGSRAVELGRYSTAAGESRVLVGRSVDGEVRISDHSSSGGRPYFVEQGFESMGELAMLVSDYKRQAAHLGHCPMSREAIRELMDHGLRIETHG